MNVAKSRSRVEVLFHEEPAEYAVNSGVRITLESLGLTPGDPVNRHILREFMDGLRAGLDINDPDVQADCVAAGRQRALDLKASEESRGINKVVYYLRVGKYIKIGTAVRLEERLKSYPPDTELLATEPGHYNTEHRRLVEFSEYLAARREWFNPGPRLMAHIEGLRAAGLAKAS